MKIFYLGKPFIRCVVASIALLSMSVLGFSQAGGGGGGPAQQPKRSVLVQVRNGANGLPIPNAPVRLIGDAYIRTTDAWGNVRFPRSPLGASTVRLWTSPAGYSPGFGEFDLQVGENAATLTCFSVDTYSTGLMQMETGGAFTFQGVLPGGNSEPFYLEIVVPPYALKEDSSLSFSVYPTWGFGKAGLPANNLPAATFHLNLRDANGDETDEMFNLPVTFKTKSWYLDLPAEYDGMDSSWVDLNRFDYASHEFKIEAAQVRINAVDDLIEFDVMRHSCFLVGIDYFDVFDWLFSDNGGEVPPSNSPLLTTTVTYECEDRCNAGISCGKYTGNCNIEVSKGTDVTVSASLESNLNATYGTEAKSIFGSVSGEVGVSLTTTLGGAVKASTNVKVSGGFTNGATASSPCYSGTAAAVLVYKKTELKAAGVSLGSIKVPYSTAIRSSSTWDTTCGEDCEMTNGPAKSTKSPCD